MANNPGDATRRLTGEPSAELLARARAGDQRALSALFGRHATSLRKWARGRLPRFARAMTDTADVVQDVLMQTFRRLDLFEDRGKGTLQAYLRRAVVNRINDEIRRIGRRPVADLEEEAADLPAAIASPLEGLLSSEEEELYKRALAQLSDDERILVVGRFELGYSFEQLALISDRPSPDAARMALRRAVLKMAERLSSA